MVSVAVQTATARLPVLVLKPSPYEHLNKEILAEIPPFNANSAQKQSQNISWTGNRVGTITLR